MAWFATNMAKKFSKSLGNVLDPLIVVDKLGADPLRFTLITSGTPGNDVNLDETRVDHTFRFINKVWQITSFINMNLDGELELGLAAHWMSSICPPAGFSADLHQSDCQCSASV